MEAALTFTCALLLSLLLGSCALRSSPDTGSESAAAVLAAALIDGPGATPSIAVEADSPSASIFVAAVHGHTAFLLQEANYAIDFNGDQFQDRVSVWVDDTTSFEAETIMRYAVPALVRSGAEPVAPGDVAARVAGLRIRGLQDFGESIDLLHLAPFAESIDGIDLTDFDIVSADLEDLGCAELIDGLERTHGGYIQVSMVVEIYATLDVPCKVEPALLATWPATDGPETASMLLAKARLASAGLVATQEARGMTRAVLSQTGPSIVELMRPNTANEIVAAATRLDVPIPEPWLEALQALVDGRRVFVVDDTSVLADSVRALRFLNDTAAVEWASGRTEWNAVPSLDVVPLSQGFGREIGAGTLAEFVEAGAATEAPVALARAVINNDSTCDLLRVQDIAELRMRVETWVTSPPGFANDLQLPPAAASHAVAQICGLESPGDALRERIATGFSGALAEIPTGSPGTLELLQAYTLASCLLSPGDALSGELRDAIEVAPESLIADPSAVASRVLVSAAADDGCGVLL